MAVVQTLIGNIKGPQGNQGATGATGATGAAATISVGTVSTAAYGTPAQVTNSGTSEAAVFDFVIPQGPAGATVTDASDLTETTITASAATYPVPTAGEKLRVIFGKINKYLSDLLSGVNKNSANFAQVEPTSTASRAYAVGEYLVYNGVLYNVTTAITNGGTISPGGNVTAATVGGQLSNLDAKITHIATVPSGSSVTLTVPNGCRCLIAALGVGAQQNSVWTLFKGSGATPKVTQIGGGSGTTVVGGSGIITITNGDSGNGLYVYGIALNNNLPTT